MRTQASKAPRSNLLGEVDFSLLHNVPAYMRKGVVVVNIDGRINTFTKARAQ